MPNHVKNILKFNKKKYPNIFKELLNEKGNFDFNLIIPTPDNIYQGDLGEKERKLYGKNNWYDWNCENWGTKWNAYDNEQKENEIYNVIIFETAWSCPKPIIEELAKKYDFMYYYADEDIGYNCGKKKAINGMLFEQHFSNAKRFANNVWKY